MSLILPSWNLCWINCLFLQVEEEIDAGSSTLINVEAIKESAVVRADNVLCSQVWFFLFVSYKVILVCSHTHTYKYSLYICVQIYMLGVHDTFQSELFWTFSIFLSSCTVDYRWAALFVTPLLLAFWEGFYFALAGGFPWFNTMMG